MSDPSGRFDRSIPLFIFCGFLIGAVAWSGCVYALPAVIFLPLLLTRATDRTRFGLVVAAYNAGATWTLVPGASIFYGQSFSLLNVMLLWTIVVAILTAPWLLIRPFGPIRIAWGLPITLILIALLPTGIADPITAAGVLFPGTGWVGLAATLGAFSLLCLFPLPTLAAVLCATLICNISYPSVPAVPAGWKSINTEFGGDGLDAPNYRMAYIHAQNIQRAAIDSDASVIVFPESIVKDWTPVTDLMWQDAFRELRSEGKTLIVGAEIPLPGRNRYENALVIRGSEQAVFRQRVPIPYAMWMPFSGHGVPLNYTGPAIVTIQHQRVAPIICYEQLLVAPILGSILQQPSILFGAANDYWARGTAIPAIQASALGAWSRLFRVPIVTAVNQ